MVAQTGLSEKRDRWDILGKELHRQENKKKEGKKLLTLYRIFKVMNFRGT